jgi:hypothetical protein
MELNLKRNYKMKLLFSLTFLFSFVLVHANQNDTVFWRPNPNFIVIDSVGLDREDAIIIEDNRFLTTKHSKVSITRHRILQVNSQRGLDKNNKIVIYLPEGSSIENIEARSISPSGKIVELNKDNIKQMENYGSGDAHLFAIEGATVGCQIEYSYTLTSKHNIGIERFSTKYRTLKAFLLFDHSTWSESHAKGFNGNFEEKSLGKRRFIVGYNLLPIQDELYSTPDANQPMIEYQFGINYFSDTKYRWYYSAMKTQLSFRPVHYGRALSEISKFKLKDKNDDEKTLSNLDKHIKRTYFFMEEGRERDEIGQIFMTNKANETGFIKLYALMLNQLNIDYQLLYTCSKYDRYFDTTAFSYYNLQDYIFYFPTVEKYLDPLEKTAHFGVLPYEYIGNNAFVVYDSEEYTVFQNKIPIKFHNIKSEAYDQNNMEMNIKVDISVEKGESNYSIKGSGEGQFAYGFNEDIYHTETLQEENEAMINLVEWRYPDEEVLSCKMVDHNKWGNISTCEDYKCKRSYIAEVRSGSFFETVGDKLILRVGTLIGPQDEFKAKYDRVQDIVSTFNKTYTYHINIKIPKGYSYVGDQNVNLESTFDNNGNKIAQFRSELRVEGDVISIEINEMYNQVIIDKKYFTEFREVINTAAAFNSGVILLKRLS